MFGYMLPQSGSASTACIRLGAHIRASQACKPIGLASQGVILPVRTCLECL